MANRLQVLLGHLLPNATPLENFNTNTCSNHLKISDLELKVPTTLPKVSLKVWKESVGTQIGASEWVDVSQDRIDAFATVTGDHQWIHQRGAKEKGSPFGNPIAHGFLVLALVPYLADTSIPTVEGVKMLVNYGINKLRFVSPVAAGKKVRMVVTLAEVTSVENGINNVLKCEIQVQGEKKPAIVLEWLTRCYFK